jgi:hypothetical protein
MSDEQRKEIERLTHLLAASQSEREQLRINNGKHERVQYDLLNQVNKQPKMTPVKDFKVQK